MAEQQTNAEKTSAYVVNLESAIDRGLSAISSLKDQLIVDPQTKQEKNTNKTLQEQLEEQQKKVDNWKKSLQKEIQTLPNVDTPQRSGEGRNFQLADVSDQRLEQGYGVTGLEDPEVQRLSAAADTNVEQAESDTEALRQLGQQLLTGNIPVDVSEAVARASAAGALSRGVVSGSQMARNLTARDLGMTSLDLMTKGGEVMGTTAQLSQSLAAFQESRAQYRTQFQLASAELRDAIRKTDLSVAQLAEEKHQFKQKMTLALNEQIINMAQFREELNFKYAATKLEGDAGKAKGPLSTIDNIITQIRGSLSL